MTAPQTCYNNCLRSTLLSKSEKISFKFNYVAGWITDEKGVRHEHAFLHTANQGLDYYFDPTLQNDVHLPSFKYEIGRKFSIAEIESLLLQSQGPENYKLMRNGTKQWPDMRYVDDKYTFQ